MNITLYSLHDYVAGRCIPFTIELDGLTKDDYLAEIADNLERISEEMQDGELREEWIVCDYEDIPKKYVGEYDLDDEFFAYTELIENSNLDADIIEAGVDCDIPLSDIEEAYSGTYDNDEDFAYEMADSCGLINNKATWPNNCIDWERAARDLMFDYRESNHHYFRIM